MLLCDHIEPFTVAGGELSLRMFLFQPAIKSIPHKLQNVHQVIYFCLCMHTVSLPEPSSLPVTDTVEKETIGMRLL